MKPLLAWLLPSLLAALLLGPALTHTARFAAQTFLAACLPLQLP